MSNRHLQLNMPKINTLVSPKPVLHNVVPFLVDGNSILAQEITVEPSLSPFSFISLTPNPSTNSLHSIFKIPPEFQSRLTTSTATRWPKPPSSCLHCGNSLLSNLPISAKSPYSLLAVNTTTRMVPMASQLKAKDKDNEHITDCSASHYSLHSTGLQAIFQMSQP